MYLPYPTPTMPRTPHLSDATKAAIALWSNMMLMHTGGGCWAIEHPIDTHELVWITSQINEAFTPSRMDEPVVVGRYLLDADGCIEDDGTYEEFRTLREALRHLWGDSDDHPAELFATEPDDGILGLYLFDGWTIDQQDDLVVSRTGPDKVSEYVVLRRQGDSPEAPIATVDYSAWQNGYEIAQLDKIDPLYPLTTLAYAPFLQAGN